MNKTPKFKFHFPHPKYEEATIKLLIYEEFIFREERGEATREDETLGIDVMSDHMIKEYYYYTDIKKLRLHKVWDSETMYSIFIGVFGFPVGNNLQKANEVFEFIHEQITT